MTPLAKRDAVVGVGRSYSFLACNIANVNAGVSTERHLIEREKGMVRRQAQRWKQCNSDQININRYPRIRTKEDAELVCNRLGAFSGWIAEIYIPLFIFTFLRPFTDHDILPCLWEWSLLGAASRCIVPP